jgi:hypothetical protein
MIFARARSVANIATEFDAATLSQLAMRAREPAELAVLLANPVTPHAAKLHVLEEIALQNYHDDPRPSLSPEHLFDIAHATSVAYLSKSTTPLDWLLSQDWVTSQILDDVVRSLTLSDNSWFALKYLSTRYGISQAISEPWWLLATVPNIQVLHTLKPKSQKEVLSELLTSLTTGPPPPSPLQRLDADVLKLAVELGELSDATLGQSTALFYTSDFLTDDAIDLLLEYPSWHQLLWHQTLKLPQFMRLAALTDKSQYLELLRIVSEDADCVHHLVSLLSDDVVLTTDEINIIGGAIELTDPLWSFVIDHMDSLCLTRYILGSYRDEDTVLLPALTDLATLVAKVYPLILDRPYNVASLLKEAAQRPVRSRVLPLDYSVALLECMPGYLGSTLEYGPSELIDHITKELRATGADPAFISDQLGVDFFLTLSQYRTHLSAFVRATVRSM